MPLSEAQELELLELEAEAASLAPRKVPFKSQTSPLTVAQRAKFGFGNPKGILENLKGDGVKANYQDGELMVDGKPADPNNLGAYLRGMNPLTSLYDTAYKPFFKGENPMQDAVKDLPSDFAELPADALNMMLTTQGGMAGATAGMLTGPAASVLAPAGMIAGSGAGGFAAEKAKQGIGEMLGVYKTSDDYITPEAGDAALWSAGSAVLPAGLQYGKGALRGLANLGKRLKLPQRVFSGATGMGSEFVDDPQVIDTLLREGASGSRQKLISDSSQKMKGVYGPQIDEILKAHPDVSLDDVLNRMQMPRVESGSRATAKTAVDDVLDEFKALFNTQTEEVVGGVMKRPSYDQFKNDFLERHGKRQLVEESVSAAPAGVMRRPSFDEYKAQISSKVEPPVNPSNGDLLKEQIQSMKAVQQSKASPQPSEEDFLRLYQQAFPEETIPLAGTGKVTKTTKSPLPTEEDISRLYAQSFPNEEIPLATLGQRTSKTLPLTDLREEVTRLSNAASSIYDNPDVKAQLAAKAKKSLADAGRSAMYAGVGDDAELLRPAMQSYHSWSALRDAMEKKTKQAANRPMATVGLADMGVGGGAALAAGGPAGLAAVAAKRGLETTAAQTKIASWLNTLVNKGSGLSKGINAMPKTQAFIQLLEQLGKSSGDLRQ